MTAAVDFSILERTPASAPQARTSPAEMLLVAGVPRGGTTMALELCGELSGVFAWPGESWVLPLTRSLWAGGPPNPACRSQIEEHVHAGLMQALMEMQQWNNSASGRDGLLLPEEADIALLAHEVVEGALSASSMRKALLASAAALSRFIGQFTDEALVVEKTPSNFCALTHLSNEPDIHWILSHREPFSVIASMQRRVGADPYAADWDGAVEPCLGKYLRAADSVIRAMRTRGGHVVSPYDATYGEPARLQALLASRFTPELKRQKFFKPRNVASDAHAWKQFSPLDRWKILRFSEPVRRLLGYDEAYYGVGEETMTEGATAPTAFEAVAMDGVWPDGWMSEDALFAIYAPHEVRRMRATFINPESLALADQRLAICDGRRNIVAEIALGPGETEVEIDLDLARPEASTQASRAFLIEVRAARKLLPVATIPGNYDERVVSCRATPWRAV